MPAGAEPAQQPSGKRRGGGRGGVRQPERVADGVDGETRGVGQRGQGQPGHQQRRGGPGAAEHRRAAAAYVQQRHGDRERGPRGRLERARRREDEPRTGRAWLVLPGQCQPEAHEPDHGQVVPARRQGQRDQGRGRERHRAATSAPQARRPEAQGEGEQEDGAEDEPGVEPEEPVRQPQQRHPGEVGVVGGVVGTGERFGGQVGRAVRDEAGGRPVDDAHFLLRAARPDEEEQRHDGRHRECRERQPSPFRPASPFRRPSADRQASSDRRPPAAREASSDRQAAMHRLGAPHRQTGPHRQAGPDRQAGPY
ncbi:hypothetical protein DQ392_22905 [Streptomyces reniochalinae]|uniref:Uncharacterized protein n=1 Tax=Streptomyces reniochalinae TaxID=2250578 RepID=A0A367ECY3_9ACTN|nr:hypothetical protein DQ392_22905 [Streptomyces reniochalinae]